MLRESNYEVDEHAQIAYGVKMGEELTYKLIMIEKKNHPFLKGGSTWTSSIMT